MADNLFGDYLRQRRQDVGLTRADLAKQANLSPSLIEKIELGTRPTTLPTLETLFNQLEVPTLHRKHILTLALPGGVITDLPTHPPIPSAEDLADLASLPHPASFYLMPTFTVIATNPAYERTFPGIVPGTNFLEWMLLNPTAPEVVVNWRTEAHRLIHTLRTFAPLKPPGIGKVVRTCRSTPLWETLWNTLPPKETHPEHLDIRNPETGEPQRLALRIYSPELPTRPWWLCRLIPIA